MDMSGCNANSGTCNSASGVKCHGPLSRIEGSWLACRFVGPKGPKPFKIEIHLQWYYLKVYSDDIHIP